MNLNFTKIKIPPPVRQVGLVLAILFAALLSDSQSISSWVQPSGGGSDSGAGVQLSFTIGQPLDTTFKSGSYMLSFGFNQPPVNLFVDTVDPYLLCAGSLVRVHFTATQYTGTGNIFTAQLSDSSGNFAGAITSLATDTTKLSGTIIASIPPDILGSTHYRIRVVSSYPYWVGGPSGYFTINTMPQAAIDPSDTALYPGDTVVLVASGGTSYYWPQLNSDSPSVAVVFMGDSMDFFVNVTDNDGCGKDAHSHLRLGPLSAVVADSLIIINPTIHDTILSLDSNIIGCHDVLLFTTTVVESGSTDSFDIVQALPLDGYLIPDTSALFVVVLVDDHYDTLPVPTSGTGQITFTWNGYNSNLTWQIPAGYFPMGANFQLIATLYTNCSTSVQNGKITTLLYVPPSTTAQIGPTIYNINITMPGITATVLNNGYANPNDTVYEKVLICATSDNAPVYQFTITPDPPLNSLQTLSINNIRDNPDSNITLHAPYTVTGADMDTLLGRPYLTADSPGCLVMNVGPFITPDTCPYQFGEVYNWSIGCNTGSADANMIESCPADSSIDSINVNDNGNHGPLRVSSQLIEGGNVVSSTGGIRICSEPFAIKYQIFNPDDTSSSQPANSNAKLLHSFIVKLDPNWIDTGKLVITFTSPAGTVDTLAFTDTAGLLTIQLPGSTLNDSSTCYVELNGLKVDSTGPGSCSPPINDTIVGVAAVSFYTNCGTLYTDSSEPSTVYRNNLDLQPSSYTLLNNLDPPQVSPGDAPVLYFTWKNLQHGSPWNFSDRGNTDSSFFKCDSIVYTVALSLPSLIKFYGSAPHYLHYTHGDSIELTVQTNGTWQATLPADTLGKLDTIWVQVQLGDSCPPDFAGGFIYPSLTISATCTDSGCSQVYCFETLTNVVFVHCGGICNGTGIGTDTLAITNINAPRVAAAYACDVLDFRVRGTGYTGNFPDSTTNSIFLVLNYPSIHDSTDTVFDVAGASATFSYPGHISDSTSISNPVYNATNSTWTVVVYIKDSLACRAIRADGDTFDIDLQLPVECDLPFYNNQYQGYYTLDAINAYFGFNTNTGDTSYSCDPVAANFWLIAHQYGTAPSFVSYDTGSNPCSQTLIITDSAIYGQTTGPEMPGYDRPLITWPGDGSITVTYPDNMSISGVAYIDSSGALYGPPYDSSVAGVGDTIKHFFGYWNGTQYTWPDSGKTGPEFLRQLIVHFTQTGCGGDAVTVHLPHELRDGNAPGTCSAAICSPIITDTFTLYSLSDSGLVALSDSLTGASHTFIQPLLTMNPFTVPFNLINHTSLGPGSVYIYPTFSAATGVIQPGISFSHFPSVPLSFNSYDSLPGEHPDISVTLNTCANQIINLPVGYVCGGGMPDSADFCVQNNSTLIEVIVEAPVVSLKSDASLSSGVNFPDCKGICCGDSLFWHLVIVNEGNPPHIGPAYNPVFSLTPQSPGILNISKINFTYTPVGSHLPYLVSVLPGTGVNVYSDTLALLGFPLPGDGRNNFYLAPGDSVTTTVYLYGDGANCSTYANLEADIYCANVCGKAIATPGLVNTYTFNFNRCSPDSCPNICQGLDAWSVCNPCDNRPPINISPAVKEPDCLTSDGSITLQVSGGLNNGSLLEFNYAWSAPYDQVDTNSIDGLSPGVYSVIVSQLGCSDTLSFTLDNSNFTVSADVQDADCNNGGGSINIVTIRGGTAPFSHRWNTGDTTAAISNLAAGFYTDTIRSSGNTTGCADSSVVTFLINQPVPAFIVDLSATNIGCGNNPGTVEVARALNDTGSLSYRWSYQNDSTQLITVNDTGTYKVTVTDIVGCTASASAVVKDTAAATLGNNPFVSAKNICAGEGDTVKIFAQGFTGDTCNVIYMLSAVADTAYNIYFRNGLGVFAINPQIDTSTGSNAVTVAITSIALSSNPACSAATGLHATFIIDTVPTENIVVQTPLAQGGMICAGQAYELQGSLNPDDYNHDDYLYEWTEQGTALDALMRAYTFTAPDSGIVIYTVTFTNNISCKTSATDTFQITGGSTVSITPADTMLCAFPDTILLTAHASGDTGAYRYDWSNHEIDSAEYIIFNGSAIYKITVTALNGCTASAVATVDSDRFAIALSPGAVEVCNGQDVLFTASSDSTISSFSWSGSSSTAGTASYIITSSLPDTIVVSGTDRYGCTAKASATAIADNPLSIATTNGITCSGASAVAIATGGTPGYTYLWNTGAVTDSITDLPAGIYGVTVTDSKGCAAAQSDTIIEPEFLGAAEEDYYPDCSPGNNASILGKTVGGTPPYSYHWNTGATTQNLDSVAPGSYGLTITDANGCQVKDTLGMAYHSPVLINLLSISPACTGNNGAIHILASGGVDGSYYFTYTWSNGDSAVLDNLTPDTIANLVPGSYSVTVTESGGGADSLPVWVCSASATYYVDSTVSLSIMSSVTGCYGSYSDTLTALTNALSPVYHWSNGDSAQSIVVSNSGVYAITVSDTLGCSATLIDTLSIDSVPAYKCCFSYPADTVIYIGSNDSTSNLTIPPGSQVYVAPGVTLTVNTNFTFTNNEVVMGGNSEIVVLDTFNILGSTLKGCDTMWLAIDVLPGTVITIDSNAAKASVIEDAVYGVIGTTNSISLNSSKMLLRHSKFYRNQHSVLLHNYHPFSNGDYDISDCYFGMGNNSTMLPAPAGQSNFTRPVDGVLLEWTYPFNTSSTIDTISIPNPWYEGIADTFQYLNCGIYMQCGAYARYKTVNVFANSFDSIRNYENAYSYEYGAAVAADAFVIGATASLQVQTSSSVPDSFSTPLFTNCDYGIKTDNCGLSAQNNRMENITNGVYIQNTNSNIYVYYNYLHQTLYGISLLNNSNATQVIDTNIIYVTPVVTGGVWVPIGYDSSGHFIVVDSVYWTTYRQTYGIEETEVTSSNTIIKHNAIWQGVNSIVLSNATGTQISSNTMHLACNSAIAPNQAGLYAANCQNLLVSHNTVDADSNYYSGAPAEFSGTTRFHKSGLAFYSTPTGKICSNTLGGTTAITGIGYGMLFSAYCDHLDVHDNTMNQSTFGITLQSSGIASVLATQGSPTESQENNFIGAGSGNFLSTYRTGSYIYTSGLYNFPQFYYDSVQALTNPDSGYAIINDTLKPGEAIRGHQTVIDTASYDCPELVLLPSPFPVPIQNTNFIDTVIAQNNVGYYMEPDFDTSGPWLDAKILYQSLYNDTAILNHDSLLNAFYSNESSSDFAAILQSEIQNQIVTDSATLNGSSGVAGGSTYSAALAAADSLNNMIADSVTQTANYKAMSGIYLQTLASGIDTFTGGQLDTITTLAKQCPYSAGDAVYMARALYAQYDNTIFFDDLAICTSSRSHRMMRVVIPTSDTTAKTITSSDYIMVFPNPAKNILRVFYSSTSNASIIFELIDITGQRITSAIVPSMATIDMDVSHIADALYLWRGLAGKTVIYTGKVSVQK